MALRLSLDAQDRESRPVGRLAVALNIPYAHALGLSVACWEFLTEEM